MNIPSDYHMVGNKHEGCGHCHRSAETARRCLEGITRKFGPNRYSVYRVRKGMKPERIR